MESLRNRVVAWIRSNYFPAFGSAPDAGGGPGSAGRVRSPFNSGLGGPPPQTAVDLAWIVERIVMGMSDDIPPVLFLEHLVILSHHEVAVYIEQHGDGDGQVMRTLREMLEALARALGTPLQPATSTRQRPTGRVV